MAGVERRVKPLNLGIALFLHLILFSSHLLAQDSRDRSPVDLQAQLYRALSSIKTVGNFTYRPRWYWNEGVRVSPCKPDSPPYLDAAKLLSNVDAQIASGASEAQLEPLRVQLKILAAHPCFATSAALPYFRSVNFLNDFWSRGGRLAFETALNVITSRSYVLRPDARPSVLDFVADHPGLARFVCSSPADCTIEEQWKVSLQDELEVTALRLRLKQLKSDSTGWIATPKRCALAAATAPKDQQFVYWRECSERIPPEYPLLPRGNFRAPKAGWLFLYVEDLKTNHSGYLAINLTTGGALRIPYGFVCSPPLNDSDGELGLCGTGFASALRISLDVQEVRQLLWQLLLQARVTTGRPQPSLIEIPQGIAPTSIVIPTLGHCLGSRRPDATVAWALADRAGALIASDVDDSRSGSLLARTRLRYESIVATARSPENLRKGQARWWPRTSSLLKTPWNSLVNTGLFEVLKKVETNSWDSRAKLVH